MPTQIPSNELATQAHDARARMAMLGILALTVVGLSLGLYTFWHYLLAEHRRLRPWHSIPMWVGDLTAVYWFISAITSRSTRWTSTDDSLAALEERRRRRRVFVLTMSIATVADLVHTAHLHWLEASDFAKARVVRGDVVAARLGRDRFTYYLSIQFRDAMNRNHEEEVRVHPKATVRLPAGAHQALLLGRVPFPIRLSFDPGYPPRCWLTDLGYSEENRIYGFSYLCLAMQALVLVTFYLGVRMQHDYGIDPWWESLDRALPLLVTAAACLMYCPILLYRGFLQP